MKIVSGTKMLKRQLRASVVTVGIFDGVHIGHQKILAELRKRARGLKAIATVVTFHPHPSTIFKRKKRAGLLTSINHRLCLLKEGGAETCLLIFFNKNFSRQSTRVFIKNILIDKLNMRSLIVGESFSFGKDRIRSKERLKRIADDLNFKLYCVAPVKYHSKIISSSLIRNLVEKGRLKTAAKLLGRPVSIFGTVVRGRKIGRIIGFKTANIDPHHEVMPPDGVYAAYAKLGSKIYKSLLNIGRRPTFGEKERTLEVHLFGINRNLYGRDLEVFFKKKIRPERRFKDKESLRQQIMKDATEAKRIL